MQRDPLTSSFGLPEPGTAHPVDEDGLPLHVMRRSHLEWLVHSCPASYWSLAIAGAEDSDTVAADRGSAIHEALALYFNHLQENGLSSDYEAADQCANEALKRYSHLPLDLYGDVRRQVRNVAEQYLFNPERFFGSEQDYWLDIKLGDGLGTVRITGQLDLLELDLDEGIVNITDFKSWFKAPTLTEVRGNFQLAVYALLVLRALPKSLGIEAARVAIWATRYGVIVPGFEDDEIVYTLDDAEQLEADLRLKLTEHFAGRQKNGFPVGRFCRFCEVPAAPTCAPGDVPPVTDAEGASQVAGEILDLERRLAMRKDALKAYAHVNGPVSFGQGLAFGYVSHEGVSFKPSAVLELAEGLTETLGEWVADTDNLFSLNKRGKAWKKLSPYAADELEGRYSVSTKFELITPKAADKPTDEEES